MRPVLTAEQMRTWDFDTINKIGIPSLVLMERAALAVAEAALSLCPKTRRPRILCVCGTGNNGGDGAAAARILTLKGCDAPIFLIGSRDRLSPDMKTQLTVAERLNIPCLDGNVPDLNSYDVVIDAVFGTGLARDIEDRTGFFEALRSSSVKVVSADIPSGVNADTGKIMGCAVKADVTVTMQAAKIGHLLYPGASHTGKLVIADIGIVPDRDQASAWYLEAEDLKRIPSRDPHGNKGTFGKVLVIAGTRNMSGAAYLSSLAALKSGCGMVKLLTDEANRVVIQQTLPEIMLSTYSSSEEAVSCLMRDLDWADVIACGPALGTGSRAYEIIKTVLTTTDKPLVLDADALTVLSKETDLLDRTASPVLITPHPGEMARLTGLDIPSVTGDLIGTAAAFSRDHHLTCLLKDARTCIACENGKVFINRTGNSGMATAGSGDVLTGIAAGLTARGMSVDEAGPYAAYVHGLAGDIAAEKTGPSGLTATSLIDALPRALGEI